MLAAKSRLMRAKAPARPHVGTDVLLRLLPMLAGGIGFAVIAIAAHH